MASLPEQPERLDLRSHDIAGDKLAQLLELFPEARTEDGQIDFDQLRRALGDAVDPGKERYGLTWPGKADCFKTIQTPSLGTLLPAPEESVNWDSTQNLIIEGDNLEVLKLLQKSYLGRVKMIYIDPPYNTGNDFIYPDDYAESLKTYLEYTGQVDEEGRKFSTNTDTDGRFHSKWLNMMYPRLYLARNLLRDDGVIFISIDSGELASLLLLGNELFGEDNLIEVFSWVRTTTPAALAGKTKKTLEYIVCYERVRSSQRYKGVEKPVQSSNPLLNQSNPRGELRFPARTVTTGLPNGKVKTGTYGTDAYEVVLLSDAVVSDGWFVTPLHLRGRFRWSQEYLESQLSAGVRIRVATDRLVPSYEKDSYGREALPNLIDTRVGVGTNEQASSELRDLLPEATGELVAQMHPKPTSLIRYLANAVCEPDDMVLDFFAGSGTTAHAVLDLNAQDGGNRKFILVQLPEPTERDDYPTIADMTEERVRRVITELNEEKGESDGQDPGFRVFKLAESNFSIWDAQGSRQLGAFLEQLQLHVDNVRDDRSAEDVLFELLLKSGYPLSATVETFDLAGKRVFSVAEGALLVCLDRGLSLELMRAAAERKPERFVVLDEGFAGNDQLKANAVQIFEAGDVTFRTV